ncbi:MAG: hypothetical protein COS85_04880 [Armatimonadetes bacterium CG07_land_8_20_14_0_80_59_28]|nr:MAG: hypothetical protein COS85_04880 [Armatimonadetes bacterium CG07_land_8_20_14_0_80_59_28]
MAALVEEVSRDSVSLILVNTDVVDSRTVLIQSGTFGEHEFTTARVEGAEGDCQQIDGRYIAVRLGPSAQARLDLGLKRHVHRPSYEFPPFG